MIKLERTTAYSVSEAAVRLNMTEQAVRRYIRERRLKAHKVGRSYFMTEETLEEFVTGEKTGSSVVSSKSAER